MPNSSVEGLYNQRILDELRAVHNRATFEGRKVKVTPGGGVCKFIFEASSDDEIPVPTLLITRFLEGGLISYASGGITVFEPTGETLLDHNVYSGYGLVITGSRAVTISCEDLMVPIGSLPDEAKIPFYVDRREARLGNLVIFTDWLDRANSFSTESRLLPEPSFSGKMYALLNRVYSLVPGFTLRKS